MRRVSYKIVHFFVARVTLTLTLPIPRPAELPLDDTTRVKMVRNIK